MIVIDGERYLVSMLGGEVGWVRNVKAAGGNVTIRHGRREKVHLEDVAMDQRATVLKAYLMRAPSARPHFSVDKDASLSEFERVAAQFPVFRVIPVTVSRVSGRSVSATRTERNRTLPGDEIIRNPIRSITDAITIGRGPHDVWPWLVQMGAGRAGWYSYDFIDNGGRLSADRILPEFQSIAIGTLFPAVPGATDAFVVEACEVGRSIVLSWTPKLNGMPNTTWAFVLEELEPGYTRLIERGRVRSPYRPYGLPEWLANRLAPVANAVMVRKHLHGIAQRAEARASCPPNRLLQLEKNCYVKSPKTSI